MEASPRHRISVAEALELLLAEVAPLPSEIVTLKQSNGRILQEAARATHNSPPFPNTSMDGFAVRASELASASESNPVRLSQQGEVSAGAREISTLESGKVLRINTGAPLPHGADAVVRIEDVDFEDAKVVFFQSPKEEQNIRRAGEDYHEGDVLLNAGHRVTPASVGLLASLGVPEVSVARRPRVALISTGDELLDPGEPLGFGQIYNSTRYALHALLGGFGAEVSDFGRSADSPEETRKILAAGFDFDLMITTGGVSMGSRDLVRPTLLELGAREIFWKVRQRPGQPLFAARKGSTLCLGLPGNPVSVFVTALLYARSVILRMQGAASIWLPWRKVRAASPFPKPQGLEVFSRADFVDDSRTAVVPSSGQGSHQFSALALSAGIVRLAEDSTGAAAGDEIDFLEIHSGL